MREKGFTLVEVLIMLSLSSIVTVAALAIIYQVVWGTSRTNSLVVPVLNIDRAAQVIKKDLMMSLSLNLTDGNTTPQDSVAMNWTDYTIPRGGEDITEFHSSSYVLSGTDLMRTYNGVTSIVGRNIASVGFTLQGSLIKAVITSTAQGPLGDNQSITIEVSQRQDGLP